MTSLPDSDGLTHLSISSIRELADSGTADDNLINLLNGDTRAGVRSIARKLIARKRSQEKYLARQKELCAFETTLHAEGKRLIAGVDEAGRGPLAGPVVASAVILPEHISIPGLDDSKKLTHQKREELFDIITSNAIAWGIGMCDNEEIDLIGILRAAMKAMCLAVNNMKLKPDIALVDGNQSPGLSCAERCIIDGDARCFSIAAASVIAKVTRDRIMVDLDHLFPEYGFAIHKGYGTSAHVEALRQHGPCEIHRLSFKIVPHSAPSGTLSAVLKKKLSHANNRTSFERIVTYITHVKKFIPDQELIPLREIYRERKGEFLK